MKRFTNEELQKIREVDLLSYLRAFEPNNLKHISRNTYCTREHDSLKISNGKWFWFSRNFGGRNALDYLIKVKGVPYYHALQHLAANIAIPIYEPYEPPMQYRTMILPEFAKGIEQVESYLSGRGISKEVIRYCHDKKLLFESAKHHECVFLGYDGEIPRFGAVRSTDGNTKKDLKGSDKRFSFCIPSADLKPAKLHVFEGAIDAMSYATLELMKHGRQAWSDASLLSLSGIYSSKQADSIPIALQTYLDKHPKTAYIELHLDNDEVGRRAAKQILEKMKDQYEVVDQPAKSGKDYNDYLLNELQKEKNGKEMEL